MSDFKKVTYGCDLVSLRGHVHESEVVRVYDKRVAAQSYKILEGFQISVESRVVQGCEAIIFAFSLSLRTVNPESVLGMRH